MAIFVNVLGTLGKDAEIKTSKKDNKEFVVFSLATNTGFKENKTTLWMNCSYFNTNIAPFLLKGKQVFIQGELTASAYLTKQNEPAYDLKVSVRNIELTHDKQEENPQADTTAKPMVTPNDFKEDDIPF